MTYQEYYNAHIRDRSFFSDTSIADAYPTLTEFEAFWIASTLNNKILALASGLEYKPVWAMYEDNTIAESERVNFISQYALDKLIARAKDGFNERETENKRDLAITINNDNSTVNTFKSFPQVTGTELTANNKIAESETNNNGEAETTNEAERDLTRQHNSVEATEYLAHFIANTLNNIARDYVQLTALDGIYSQPEDLDD